MLLSRFWKMRAVYSTFALKSLAPQLADWYGADVAVLDCCHRLVARAVAAGMSTGADRDESAPRLDVRCVWAVAFVRSPRRLTPASRCWRSGCPAFWRRSKRPRRSALST